mgnify:CR=1 FL=1
MLRNVQVCTPQPVLCRELCPVDTPVMHSEAQWRMCTLICQTQQPSVACYCVWCASKLEDQGVEDGRDLGSGMTPTTRR